MAWGDDQGGQAMPAIPDQTEEYDQASGITTITTYRKNALGQSVKTVQKVKVTKKTVSIPKTVVARRKWEKFGDSKGRQAGHHGKGYTDAGTTNIDVNDQTLEMTPVLQVKDEVNESAGRAFDKMTAVASEAWRPKNRGDTSTEAAAAWAAANGLSADMNDSGFRGGGGEGGSLAALAARAGAGAGAGYVPPSMRNADGSKNMEKVAERDDSCTVRVSNLSEDVKDSDLRELFRRFGAIQRVYLAKDRETQQSRGFAFINFYDRSEAQMAIDKLNGHGYDHLILSVSWANPSAAPVAGAPPPGGAAFGPTPGAGAPPGERPKLRLAPAGSGTGAKADVTSRFDSHVFDSGLDRFRT